MDEQTKADNTANPAYKTNGAVDFDTWHSTLVSEAQKVDLELGDKETLKIDLKLGDKETFRAAYDAGLAPVEVIEQKLTSAQKTAEDLAPAEEAGNVEQAA